MVKFSEINNFVNLLTYKVLINMTNQKKTSSIRFYYNFFFRGHNIWSLVLLNLGAGKYPREYLALMSLVEKKSLNPGDVTVVCLFSSLIFFLTFW